MHAIIILGRSHHSKKEVSLDFGRTSKKSSGSRGKENRPKCPFLNELSLVNHRYDHSCAEKKMTLTLLGKDLASF